MTPKEIADYMVERIEYARQEERRIANLNQDCYAKQRDLEEFIQASVRLLIKKLSVPEVSNG